MEHFFRPITDPGILFYFGSTYGKAEAAPDKPDQFPQNGEMPPAVMMLGGDARAIRAPPEAKPESVISDGSVAQLMLFLLLLMLMLVVRSDDTYAASGSAGGKCAV